MASSERETDANNDNQLVNHVIRRARTIKIGAKVVRHAKAVTFQMAEVAVPRALFAAILGRIGRLRAAPSPG